MTTETINQEAAADFVAQAKAGTTEEIRTVMGRMEKFSTPESDSGQRPIWHGEKVNSATIRETLKQMAKELNSRGAACFYCAFGAWPKGFGGDCQHD